MVYKKDINKLFRELRNAGFYAKQDYWCCQSCAWSDVPIGTEKVVFYHRQDKENSFCGNDYLFNDLYLAWGGEGNTEEIGKEIATIISNCGLKYRWDGTEHTRFSICVGG